MREKVLVIDYGGQYVHLIARRCRELGAYSEIVDHTALRGVRLTDYSALILSGGPKSVYDTNAPQLDPLLVESGIPVLGICYGHQLIAKAFGGEVARSSMREYGRTKVSVEEESVLFAGSPREQTVWMSHGDVVLRPPEGFRVVARSENGLIAALESTQRPIFTVQFHPEVKHTENGALILENFLRRGAGLRDRWRPIDRISEIIEEVRKSVPEGERVLLGVSGGIDSLTTAAVLHRAIGSQLHAVFVDHGLLRSGEAETVMNVLKAMGLSNVHFVDAKSRFLEALRGISDPEEKRKVLGALFIEVFKEVASGIGGVKYLAQGTIYPDRVESGATGTTTSVIKSHHNVGGLPKELGLGLIEPLRDLYKDEVRDVARALGLPEHIVRRHPFPGPGLAVRVVGEVTEEKLEVCRRASAIVEEELIKSGLYDAVWQAFAVVGDDRWVGVKGDEREEGRVVIVRIVSSEDGMTADWVKLDHELLDRISRRITNEVYGVTMVCYAVSSKPPSTIEPC
ncbi:MAG: glutamine-hydrolyzing GMP synthase [Thaumarchaeota archaeon]|nr:glutamine-hydrolyzing GMP synthase [Candidatus Calditenuaceae archaeon]MDW8041452.1 glutamine-hydrolyzing GMP synthase [Nitrososphaerota archaeon]